MYMRPGDKVDAVILKQTFRAEMNNMVADISVDGPVEQSHIAARWNDGHYCGELLLQSQHGLGSIAYGAQFAFISRFSRMTFGWCDVEP